MNTRLLSKVQHNILSNPATFDALDLESDILGIAVKAAGLSLDTVDAYVRSRTLLRISAAQRDALSHLQLWPRKFRRAFNPDAATNRELKLNAQIAAARIEHFIGTGC